MSNILIVGFDPSGAIRVRREINDWVVANPRFGSSVTTIVNAEVRPCKFKREDKAIPYLVVRDSDEDRAWTLARLLNEKLNLDVEAERLLGFLPRKEGEAK